VKLNDGYAIGGHSQAYVLDFGCPLFIRTDLNGYGWIQGYIFTEYSAYLNSMIALEEGGFVMTGGTWCLGMADWIYLLKIEVNGNIRWMRTYEEFGLYSYGKSVKQTEDGGFVILGHCYSVNNRDAIIIIRTNCEGEPQWSRMFGIGLDYHERDILITNDFGYFILTEDHTNLNNENIWLIKTDSTGDTLWTKIYDLTSDDNAAKIIETADGNYIIAGWGLIDSTYRAMLIKIDAEGDTIWCNFSDTTSSAGSICLTQDGGYATSGNNNTPNDWYIMKVDSLGNKEWDFTIGGEYYDYAGGIVQAEDGDFVVTGSYVPPGQSDADIWLIKISPEGVIVEAPDFDRIENFTLYGPSPNPFNSTLTITFELPDASEVELKVFDIAGREITTLDTRHLTLGENKVIWDAEGIPSGVYFIKLSVASGQSSVVSGRSVVKKVLLLK
jgi:hypothetical protein